MRILLLALGIAIASLGTGTAAQAQSYPWCATYNVGDNAINCGFVTEEQCRATVSGIGGFCSPNTQYHPPAAAARPLYSGRGRYSTPDR